jgi:hypothetical protein
MGTQPRLCVVSGRAKKAVEMIQVAQRANVVAGRSHLDHTKRIFSIKTHYRVDGLDPMLLSLLLLLLPGTLSQR